MNLKHIRIHRFWEGGQTEIHDDSSDAQPRYTARDIIESWLAGAGFGDVMAYEETSQRYYVGGAWFTAQEIDGDWVLYLSNYDVWVWLDSSDPVRQAEIVWKITAAVTRHSSYRQLQAMGYFYGGR